jgi:cell division protein FtsI/penicillin-binding protein 2
MNSRKKNTFLDTLVGYMDKYPREYYVFLFFFIFFIMIIAKTFSYTVMHHSFYKTLADNQQIGQVEIPVTRGNVYANTFSPE